jgi:hypothetical protein
MPSFTNINPGDLVQAFQVQQLIDALAGTPAKGVPLAPVALSDATNYALTVENLEATNSRALSVLKSDGTLLIRADINGVVLGSGTSPVTINGNTTYGGTVTLPSQSVNNSMLGVDVARANLLTNGGFEIWQRGTSGLAAGFGADRWNASVGAGSSFNGAIGRDSANADTAFGSTYCWSCTNYTHSAASQLDQAVETNGPGLRGRPVTFSMRVRTNVANHLRLQLIDVDGSTVLGSSAFHSGNNTYQTLSVTGTPNATTAGGKLICRVQFNASSTVNFLDNAMLVIGSVAADYAPMHSADDLARCLRYYEKIGPTATQPQLGAYDTAGNQIVQTLSFAAKKAVTPTLTIGGTFAYANASGVMWDYPDLGTGRFGATVTGTGHATVYSNSSGFLLAEANP